MRGFYRFSEDGKVIAESENIITDAGKDIIAKYLAGIVGSYAGSIAVGSGPTAAAVTDDALEFEFARTPITVRNVTGPSSGIYQVSFKGTLSTQVEGVIKESAIISQTFNKYAGSFGDRLITDFSASRGWEASNSIGVTTSYELQEADTVRVGPEGIKITATSTSSSHTISNINIYGDFSGYSGSDTVALAYSRYLVDPSTQIVIVFYTDDDNFFTGTLNIPQYSSAVWDYNIVSISKGSFLPAGTPAWDNIASCSISVYPGDIGTNLILDAVSILDTDYINPDYVMTSRTVATTPIIKQAGKTMDVEYFLEFKL